MRLPSYSATNTSPPGATATLTGLASPTAAPVPSLLPATSDPASVDTITPGTNSSLSPLGARGAAPGGHASAAPPVPAPPPLVPAGPSVPRVLPVPGPLPPGLSSGVVAAGPQPSAVANNVLAIVATNTLRAHTIVVLAIGLRGNQMARPISNHLPDT